MKFTKICIVCLTIAAVRIKTLNPEVINLLCAAL